jgi:hypothetical protein
MVVMQRALVVLLMVLAVTGVAAPSLLAAPYLADTFTSQPGSLSGEDTYISSYDATSNFGNSTALNVGETNAASNRISRTLIKFDLSGLPANATINSATLSLWQTAELSDNSTTIRVYRSLRDWSETGATWLLYKSSTAWGADGGFDSTDSEQTDIGSLALTSTEANGEKQFSLTASAIQEMVAGTFTNNGFLLKADSETDDQYQFRSSDNSTSAERPQLVIDYTVPTDTPTPTSTATATITPTPAPTATLAYGYQYQLASGKTFTIWSRMSFGDLVNVAAMVGLLLVVLVYVIYRVIDRWS